MGTWRDKILEEFTPKVARLTLAADPDGLLLEEGVLDEIQKRGFDLLPLEDRIVFRYAYESKFRCCWDLGEDKDLIVLLRSPVGDFREVPSDLLQIGRRLLFNLGDIFPNLSYPVIASLDRSDLDLLYNAQNRYEPGRLGDNATKEFVLRHVFGIAPEVIRQPSDLLRVLLRRHYCGLRIPAALDERLVQLLRQNDVFNEWPLETIVADREAFFAFLQERWSVFLDRQAALGLFYVRDGAAPRVITIPGPLDLPFEHHDVRIYIDNLFLEGLLQPIAHDHAEILSKTWVGIGLQAPSGEDKAIRLDKLVDNLKAAMPAEDSRHAEWFRFAHIWAEMILRANEQSEAPCATTVERIKELQAKVDAGFTSWLVRRYSGLMNLPPDPPVMLHQIPRFLARKLEDDNNAKIALVVVDGLALDQWLVLRKGISSGAPRFRFQEHEVFAWIPSLTSISRQAIFAGKAPVYFPNSIATTNKEPALWAQFWADQDLAPSEIAYIKGLGDGGLSEVREALTSPHLRVAGLVVDKVDRIMHGMEMGTAGMHNQVDQWVRQGFLSALFDLLMDNDFHVFLTSDHGNIEAIGCGRPSEGVMADLRGERVRLYSDKNLRRMGKERVPAALEWDSVGLPDDCLPLLAPARQAFVQEGQRTVCHGGISVEETIVPLVEITRK